MTRCPDPGGAGSSIGGGRWSRVGLERLPFFGDLPRWALVRLVEAAREEELPAGRTVLHQHDRTRTVHLLPAGAPQIYVRVGDDDLLVAVLGDPGELVGLPTALPRDRLGPLRAAEPADQLPKPSGTPGTRQLQPAPLERLPAAFLGAVIVPGG